MATVVNTNVAAMFSQRQLAKSGSMLETSLQRLSSGLRINSAKDDAAGLAISDRFTSQIKGLDVATRNTNDGISMAQTAESGLDEMTTNLQRLRELAVQASSGTLSSDDRDSLNTEAKQIKDELTRIGDTTSFNGKKLLDGSAKDVKLQIGANAHESLSFNIDGARTDQLGVMQTTSVSSSTYRGDANAGAGSENALKQGDLVINGVTIGASLASYDHASASSTSVTVANALVQKATSAISKSTAINLESGKTGVTAQVNGTRSEGVSMTVNVAQTAIITLNGVTVTSVTGVDQSSTRQATVLAINQKSGQTGVTAVDTKDDGKGIELIAADGRNIEVSMNTTGGAASSDIGIKSGVTYGTYTLSSDKAITLSEGINGRIERSGLRSGTYDKGEATLSAAGNKGTAIGTGNFSINGVLVGASRATDDSKSATTDASGNFIGGAATAAAAAVIVSASAISKVAVVNRISAQTGVTATVDNNVARGKTMSVIVSAAGTIMVNGVTTATVHLGGNDLAHSRAVTVTAINEISGRTGVRASDTGDDTRGVELIAEDGRNIIVTSDVAAASAMTGVKMTGIAYGGYTLHSSKAITIGAGNGAGIGSSEENGGFSFGTFGVGSDGTAIKDVDISTAEGAQKAITAVDYALKSIDTNRSNLGAVQNRLTSVMNQQSSRSENLSAANSRIKDTDFAKTTVEMTKAQVMQQAGVAMLAQAKAGPQQVLSLLQ